MTQTPTEEEKTRVLVVDDERDIRDACERILVRMGLHVGKASCGDDGLKQLALEKPSIVLLDLKMPGMDGMEVLKCILEADPTILVIVITGYATVETAIEAMKRGAYDFIPKPFEPAQLRIVVGRALEKIRLEAEAAKAQAERARTLLDLGTEKSRIRTIIEALPNGMMVTNARGQVVLMNPAAERFLGLSGDEHQPGESVEQYVADPGFRKLAMDISQGSYSGQEDIPAYELKVSDNRFLLVRGRPVVGEDGDCLGAVLVLVDITGMKLLDQLKNEFVAKVSHELRSPLATIHEQLAVVLRELVEESGKPDQHLLLRAKDKTQGLIALIGDLLDVSRIEAGTSGQEPRPIPVDELLKSIVDFLSAKSKAKEQELALTLPDEPLPPVVADPMALEGVFGNLITNAIHYTQEGGRVEVSARMEGAELRVDVADNGFGIEKRHLDKIFEKFYRVKNEKTRFITGTGLGLPIVKGMLESLGGRITVESEPGQGSTFTVFLPVKQGAA